MELNYYGLASANGLESFIKDKTLGRGALFARLFPETEGWNDEISRMIAGMVMSARANPQRYSVVYRARVTEEVAEEVQALLDEGDPESALIVLKERASEIALAQGVPGAKRMCERIPDSSLDPFG